MVEAGIPKMQKAFCKTAPGGQAEVIEIPVPTPARGQVLIKVECAPINPSDIYFTKGLTEQDIADRGGKISFPLAPGWEGSGTVVGSGGGFMAWKLQGKRVAFTKCEEEGNNFAVGGAFQQYAITSAMQCLELPENLSFEHACMHFVNPLTALGLIETATDVYKSAAIIQTGAASQLGRMVLKVCQQRKIPLINVVRRQEHVDLLKSLGAEYVFNSSEENWDVELGELAKKLKARACFEAVAGDITGKILNQMPSKSHMMVYGALSLQDCCEISPLLLIGRDQKIEGFLLPVFLKPKGIFALLSFLGKAQKLMGDDTLKSEVAERIPLAGVLEGIEKYQENMTKGKFILYPHME